MISTHSKFIAGLVLGAAALPALADTPRFSVTGIGAFNPTGINNVGQVSGWGNGADGPLAAVYDGATLRSLGSPSGGSVAYGINDAGALVGAYGDSLAFTYSKNTFHRIGTTASTAYAINNGGQVAGAMDVDGNSHAFLYSGNTLLDLSAGKGAGAGAIAYGLSDSGQVVGTMWDGEFAERHAFIYAGGVTTDLSGVVPGFSLARGVNASGQVILSVDNGGPGNRASYMYANGVATELGSLGVTETIAADINNAGFVVGTGANLDPEYGSGGFLWHNGEMRDLNALIDPASGWTITRATGINDRNQIAAFGCRDHGACQALLLDVLAVPEPSGYALMAGGLGLLGYALRRRRAPV